MKIEGKQSISFIRTETETIHGEEQGEKTRHVKHTYKERSKRTLIDYKCECGLFQYGAVIPPGDYTVPLQFRLPDKMPATLMVRKDGSEAPKACI